MALHQALAKLMSEGKLETMPLASPVAAVSVGVVDGEALLDLCYLEDSRAEVDMNVVMNGEGRLIEVQASGEGNTFTRAELAQLLDLAEGGIAGLVAAQRAALALTVALA